MTVKTFPPSVPAIRPDNGPPFAKYVSDLSHEQYAIIVETACTWFRTMETLCQARQQAAHDALRACEGAARKLHTADAPANLLHIHADLVRFYLESPVQYGQQLSTTGLQTQIEMMARFNRLFVGNTKEHLEKAFSNFQKTLPASSAFFDEKIDATAPEALAS
jgi:hypothetical protein